MGTFFQELAKQLAERWLTLLLLPGVLLAAAAATAVQLGHRHALDYARLERAASKTAAVIAQQSIGSQALLAIIVLLASTGIGLAVQSLACVTRRVWLGPWLPPLAAPQRWQAARRRARWRRRLDHRRALEHAYPRPSRTPDQQRAIDAAADRTNRIAWAEPGRPTWMGDRVHSLEQIALHRHGLDLAFAWPRLWLVLPDTPRSDITAANAAFASAAAVATWAWPYLLLGILWWPAALAGVGLGVTGWARARSALNDLTILSESAIDLHGRALAIAIGVAAPTTTGPLTIPEGEQITALTRKGR
ncbi:hypothetical protein P3T36_007407 [Kitasatospora sp. MAP12-15]|uniref:hypothetical protein n=1 Tax=unclassified Kitasatospora TaxID=2633591 RepID=UPI002474FAF7|nr:hypothetical protein [Kitasatospora sp. MAP12-44]MDH6109195.1 hypothetical protein [Kitasatospora sp. MAP12-44]